MLRTLLIGCLLSLASLCQATTIQVPLDQPTIQAAILAAFSGDTVLVAVGAYNENITIDKDIVVKSVFGAELTEISVFNTSNPLVTFSNTTTGAVIEGFTLAHAGNTNTVEVGSKARVSENIFHSNTVGIGNNRTVIRVTSSATIDHNLFYNNGGINCIWTSVGAEIINNTFVDNARGIYSTSSGTTVLNNIISESADYGITGTFGVVDYNCTWNNGYENNGGPNGFFADPLFVDASQQDFKLSAESPCIDAGHPDETYNDPDGTRNDIGAFRLHIDSKLPIPIYINLGSEEQFHVLSTTPVFYWTFFDTLGTQTAIELEVGTDSIWTVSEVWQTGEVTTGLSSIDYAGLELVAGTFYFMRLRVKGIADWGDWIQWQFRLNSPPSIPIQSYPIADETVSIGASGLTVQNSSDAEDLPSYDYEVYGDAGMSVLVFVENKVAAQISETKSSPLTNLIPNQHFWWRARAFDGYEHSDWTDLEPFYLINAFTVYVPTDKPTIQSAIDLVGSNDTIQVAAGIYIENIDFKGKEIVVFSEDGPKSTFLQPADPDSTTVAIVLGEGSGTYFGGFTVEGGANVTTMEIHNSSPTIENNIFRDNIPGGVISPLTVIRVTSAATIRKNLFYNNGGINTIYCGGGANVINNTLNLNARGILGEDGTCDVFNNIVTNSDDYGIWGSFDRLDYNCVWQNGYGNTPGTNGLVMDPLFTDEASQNYTLLRTSPCIDAGNPSSLYNDADASRNDIGAFALYDGFDLPLPFDINFDSGDNWHVLSTNPTIYWSIRDTIGLQSAYELEVGNDNEWDVAEFWSSDVIASGDTSIIYSGSTLDRGENYNLRLRLYGVSGFGSWIEIPFRINSLPIKPVPFSPIGGEGVPAIEVILFVQNSFDQDGDSLSYDFELYEDAAMQNLLYSEYSVQEQTGQTNSSSIFGLAPNQTYYWRVRAYDGFENSSWTVIQHFYTEPSVVISVPQDELTIQAGIDAADIADTVMVSPGIYYENINLLNKRIVLMSSGGAEYTTIHANDIFLPVVNLTGNGSIDVIIQGFTITGSSYSGIQCDELDSALITQNIITGNSSSSVNVAAGISMYQTSHVRVFDNIFYDNHATGFGAAISMTQSNYDKIDHNILYGNIGTGEIRVLESSSGLEVINNTISVTTHSGIIHQGTSPIKLINNIIFFAPTYAVGGGGTYVAEYNSTFSNAINFTFTPGIGNISDIAIFEDSANHDYHLKEYSLCINAGHPDALYNDPDGTRNDMGALSRWSGAHIKDAGLMEETDRNVTNHNPTIYWSTENMGGSQISHQIEVGTDYDWTVAEMWSPGETATTDSTTAYAGISLSDGVLYFTRVRVFDGIEWTPWYEHQFRMNSVPPTPILLSPDDRANVVLNPVLYVGTTVDAEEDMIEIDFQLYSDSLLVNLISEGLKLPQGLDSTGWIVPINLSNESEYWWRISAFDGFENSPWSGANSFWYNNSNIPPTAPILEYPSATVEETVFDIPPTFQWTASVDPDGVDSTFYRVELSVDSSFTFVSAQSGITTTSYAWQYSLQFSSEYWWRVCAYDKRGGETVSDSIAKFKTWALGDINGNNAVNVSDIAFAVDYLFGIPSGPPPAPYFVGDVNGNCSVNITDVAYLVSYLFGIPTGPAPKIGCSSSEASQESGTSSFKSELTETEFILRR